MLRRFAALALVLATILTSQLSAATLDQSFEGPFNGGIFVKDILDVAQTFTVGQTGQLVKVDVFVNRSAGVTEDLVLSIFDTSLGGVPNAIVPTATAPIGAASLLAETDTWISFDLSAFNLNFTAGDLLAIVLQSDATGDEQYSWVSTGFVEASYPGGAVYNRFLDNEWVFEPSGFIDVGFRTFVVPEPSSLALLLLAGMSLLINYRRR